MIIKFVIGILICATHTLAQSNICELEQPEDTKKLLPTQCCDIAYIFDEQTVKKCLNTFQGPSNIKIGIKGRFDGMECLFSCMFNSTNTFTNGNVNVQALKTYVAGTLGKINQAKWVPTVNQAIDMCNNKLRENQEKIRKSLNGRVPNGRDICSPAPLFFGSCIYIYQIQKCPFPAQNIPQNIVKNCTSLRNYLTKCETPALY